MKDSKFAFVEKWHLSGGETAKTKARTDGAFHCTIQDVQKVKTRLRKQKLLTNTSKWIYFSMDKQGIAITARWAAYEETTCSCKCDLLLQLTTAFPEEIDSFA